MNTNLVMLPRDVLIAIAMMSNGKRGALRLGVANPRLNEPYLVLVP
jgi:hypothetical protein